MFVFCSISRANSDGSLTSHFRRNGAQCWCLQKGDGAMISLNTSRGSGRNRKDVTIENLDQWTQIRCEQGLFLILCEEQEDVVLAATSRLRLARNKPPRCFHARETTSCVPLEQFSAGSKEGRHGLLKWKQLEFAVDRPKAPTQGGHIAEAPKDTLCTAWIRHKRSR